MAENILIVDDEEFIRDVIREYAQFEGYNTHEACDGMEALNLIAKNKYSAVILDVMMPKVDGWTVCREIRKTSDVPVVMLSARGEEYDKLLGFELGVDDYIVKPFSPKELIARVKAITRRRSSHLSTPKLESTVGFDGLSINFDSRNVYIDSVQISLTPKEYELLRFFATHPNKVFSRSQLLSDIWGYDFSGDDRTVDTHIKMLRESIGIYRKFIVTVWGTGYKFEPIDKDGGVIR